MMPPTPPVTKSSTPPVSGHCYIWDLDGTLADDSHRQHMLKLNPIPWDDYNACLMGDSIIRHAQWLWLSLSVLKITQIVCTGRTERTRRATETWLHGFKIEPTHMLMRGDHDGRPASNVKSDMLDKIRNVFMLTPIIAFDDHFEVVQMYRSRGVPCYQTNEGKVIGKRPPRHLRDCIAR